LIDQIWGSGPSVGETVTSNNPNVTVTNGDLWGTVTVETGDVDLPDTDAENTIDSVNENQSAPDVSSGGSGKGVLVKDDLWGDVTVESEEDGDQGTEPGPGEDGSTDPDEDDDKIYFDGPTSAD